MKRKPVLSLLALGLALTLMASMGLAEGPAPQERTAPEALTLAGNSISYQGYLLDGGVPANGIYDFTFSLYADAAGTQWVDTADAVDNEPVVDGVFTVEPDFTVPGIGDLHFDFNGEARWLRVGVRPGASTGAYTYLAPLQPLTPAPYAQALPGLHTIQNDTSANVVGGYPWNSVGLGLVGATISGGGEETEANTVNGDFGTVGGGKANTVSDNYGTVGGGEGNLSGDAAGTRDDAHYATVGGGFENQAANVYATVGGGEWNVASGIFSTIAGGQANTAIGGTAAVGGGTINSADGSSATVSGGYANKANGGYAAVGGGRHNEITGAYGTIAGGGGINLADGNRVTNDYSTVGGGSRNTVSGNYATISGGDDNTAGGSRAVVGGGNNNDAGGNYSTVAGGYDHDASGLYAMIPGGNGCTAHGSYSFAAGRHARAYNSGCFVWGDGSTNDDIECNNDDRWVARTSGGVYFYTNSGLTSGVLVPAGGNAWSSVSDRSLKENWQTVDNVALLERLVAQVPVTTWNYRSQDASVRHIGPMAQDLYAAFGLGEDAEHISTVDADGVALAAIQGLHQIVSEQESQIAEQQAQIVTLEARLAGLEEAVANPRQSTLRLPGGWLLLAGLVVTAGVAARGKSRGGGR